MPDSHAIPVQGSIAHLSPRQQLHIALAQLLPDDTGLHHPNAAQHSLAKLSSCAHTAAQAGADIVIFPEYFLSGATHGHWQGVRGSADDQDQDDKPWLEAIKQIAHQAGIDIVAGTVVELADIDDNDDAAADTTDSPDAGQQIPHRLDDARARPQANPSSPSSSAKGPTEKRPLYNTAYYVTRTGTVAHRYTKQNLWHPERTTLSSSSPFTHAEQHSSATFGITTRRGLRLRASLAICWDLAWYSRFEQMLKSPASAKQGNLSDLDVEGQAAGPDVILVPTCWYASDGGAAALRWNRRCEEDLLRSLCTTRALETEAVVVMCNVAGPKLSPQQVDSALEAVRCGESEELPLIGLGRSLIAAPFQGCVAQVDGENEALLLQSLNLTVLVEAREVYRNRYDVALDIEDKSSQR
ncbi:uncharacterized protein PFL1_02153 [Pseudozyma flocculosa PF-1]|uniref:CN hydrolase domain-containing protein n=1 Tax=Pseudozyma flocculosa TaxID=84751 RepID=A0A5C3FCL4_9BASI|nr:uncharacterized protein PFL1_02153 [Pseudozyma flocculosa PF-1]EPQ30035.1 hypothetical protein PFL1_02153 [Pseudozyma flocculosa PF-1]SPO41367.1 uncharacterized protein PSFLO_06849 [Pseudozyma flocculosa]